MATVMGDIVAIVKADSTQFKRAMRELDDSVSDVNNGLLSLKNVAIATATAVATGVALIAKESIKQADLFEQSQIAFSTMLGSAEKANQLLADLADFAKNTPFGLQDIEQNAKQLLAMGSSSEEVLKELKMLGDVSAGLSVPLWRLSLNFGQVRTQGKLTGRELRDFNVAGVPLIDTLVELGNQGKLSAGAFETVGATSSKTIKKIDDLSYSIEKQSRRLEEMKEKGNDSSASYKNLASDIERNKKKLEELGPVTSGYTQKIEYSREKIMELVEEGKIGFEDVSNAFGLMTGEGGKFYDLMTKQSGTYSGQVEKLKEEIILLQREIGEKLLPYAKDFLQFVSEKVIPTVEIFVDKLLNLRESLKNVKEWFEKNWAAADYLAIMLGTTLLFAVSKLVIGLGTALVGAITSVISSFAALGLLLLPWFAVGGLIALLYTFFDFISRKTTGFTLLEQLLAMFELIKIKLKEVVEWFDKTIDKINIFKKKSDEVGGGGGGGSWGGKASGGLVEAGRSYIVGEFGRELFVPSQSGRIIPNNSLPDNINNKSVVQNINVYPSDGLDIDTIVERLAYKYRTSL